MRKKLKYALAEGLGSFHLSWQEHEIEIIEKDVHNRRGGYHIDNWFSVQIVTKSLEVSTLWFIEVFGWGLVARE
jgi:hypothetical protein